MKRLSVKRTRTILLAGTLAVSSAVALSQPAQATTGWSAPVTVGHAAQSISSSGAAVTAWSTQTPQNTFAVLVSSSVNAVTWTPAVTLGQGVEPAVALAPNGAAVAVWQALSGPTSLGIEASVRGASGTWSAPVSVATVGQQPQVGVDSAGDAVAVWHSATAGVQTSTLPAGGSWSAPTTLTTYAYELTGLAVAPNGNALIDFGPTNSGPVEAATGSVTGSWSAPVVITPGGYHVRHVSAVLSPTGQGAAAWTSGGIGHTATLTPGLGWSAPVVLGNSSSPMPSLAVDAAGDIVAAVTEPGVVAGVQTSSVYAIEHPAGGTWRAPVLLSSGGTEQAIDPAAAATPAGTFVVAYTDAAADRVLGATALPGERFAPATQLGISTGTGAGETLLSAAGLVMTDWNAAGLTVQMSSETVP